jgi:hypothetical protein
VPDSVTVASVQQYKANVELLLQQKESRLSGAVEHGSYVGKAASIVEQFGEATAQRKTGRHSDTPLLDVSQDKRWVHPADYEWATLVDNQDKLRTIIELTNPYTQAGAAAMQRAIDDAILEAIFGTNYTGENGTTAESFSSTYEVAVATGGAASSLNVAKLQKGIELLIRANKGELMESVYGAISSYEHDALLKEIQVVSKEFGASAVLQDGKVKRFMGTDFILTERLSIVSGNRLVPMWLKSGMHLGKWQDMVTDIGPRRDKSMATQIYLCMTLGATRTQLGKQIKVLCDDQI